MRVAFPYNFQVQCSRRLALRQLPEKLQGLTASIVLTKLPPNKFLDYHSFPIIKCDLFRAIRYLHLDTFNCICSKIKPVKYITSKRIFIRFKYSQYSVRPEIYWIQYNTGCFRNNQRYLSGNSTRNK